MTRLRSSEDLDLPRRASSSTGDPGKMPATAKLPGRPIHQTILRVENAEAAHAIADRLGPRDGNGVARGAGGAVERASTTSGQALPGDLRTRFESSLGADLSAVRLHTGAESAESASAVGAKAYTAGQDVHFAEGRYDPSSAFGVHLIAHEVAHTVQQQGATPTPQAKLEVSGPADSAEVEADRAADAMVAGAPASVGAAASAVQRDIFDDAFESWDGGGYGGEEEGYGNEGEQAYDGEVQDGPPSSGHLEGPPQNSSSYQHRSNAVEAGTIKGTIYFATDDANVFGDDHAAIDQIIERYGRQIEAGEVRVEVIGFADERAGDDYNMDLATRRGDAVADQLNNRLSGGLPADTTCDAVGEVPSSSHPDDLARNRRVEIRIHEVEAPSYPLPNMDPPAQPSPGWQAPADWGTDWELYVDAGGGAGGLFGVEVATVRIVNTKSGEQQRFTFAGVGIGKSMLPVNASLTGGPYPFQTTSPVPIRCFASMDNTHVQAGGGIGAGAAIDYWILTGPRSAGADVAFVNATGTGITSPNVSVGGSIGPLF